MKYRALLGLAPVAVAVALGAAGLGGCKGGSGSGYGAVGGHGATNAAAATAARRPGRGTTLRLVSVHHAGGGDDG